MIGAPIIMAVYGQNEYDSTRDDFGDDDDNSRTMEVLKGKLSNIVKGGILGGIVGASLWIGGGVYAMWQILAGIYHTPLTLWAWVQGKTYWKEGEWHAYNLTEHHEEILDKSSNLRKNGVQDDSLYKILGVSTGASRKEIKRAYYRLAKEYHPDKQPSTNTPKQNEMVRERFLKLHSAYETLYDDEKRKAYDEWGKQSDATSGTGAPFEFDTTIFFDTLFGFSPELEPYIGDLAIKSFANSLYQLFLAFAMVQSGSNQQQQRLQEWFETYVSAGRGYSREARQIDIALHLMDFSHKYVEDAMSLDDFEMKCRTEASAMLESTPFPIMVQAVGKSLYWTGLGDFQNPLLDGPSALISWMRVKTMRAKENLDFATGLASLYRKYQTEVTLIREHARTENPNMDDDSLRRYIQERMPETMLPAIMDFVWKYNEQDIARTINAACWKVLHSTTTTNRRKQARAFKIMGTIFVENYQINSQANGPASICVSHNANDRQCPTHAPSEQSYQDRIQVAMSLATGGTEQRKKSRRHA
jgi:curved DNA-binding protein CbpA